MPRRYARPAPTGYLALAACLSAVSMLVNTAAARTTPTQLVNAQWTNRTDSVGMMWDIRQGGYIDDGTNNCFNGAMQLQINNNGVNFNQHQMTPNGQLYVFHGSQQGIQVTRRVSMNPKFPGLRYVDTFHNPTQQPQTISVTYYTRLSGQAQTLVTDAGNNFTAGSLGKNDSGLFLSRPGSQPSVILQFCSPGSKLKPSITNNSNYQFQVTYSVPIPAGKKVTLICGIGQRSVNTPPSGKAQLQKLFEPFQSRDFVKGVPRELMRSAVNWSGGLGGEAPVMFTIERDLQTEPRANADVLAIAEDTRLRGRASWDSVRIQTQFGTLQPQTDRIAALAGPRFGSGASRIYLRDGQVLAGKLEVEDLTLELAGGTTLTVAGHRLDRLVVRKTASAPQGLPSGFDAVVDTFEGDRLLVRGSGDQPLAITAVTPFGPRPIAIDELDWVHMRTDQQPAYEFALSDGSRFYGMIQQQTLAVESQLFGNIELDATDIRFLTTSAGTSESNRKESDAEPLGPHVQMSNGQRLVGQLQQPTIELLTISGPLELPTSQVRELERISDDGSYPGRAGAVFRAELWDGSRASGRLEDSVVTLAAGQVGWRVPSKSIEHYIAPSPELSEEARAEIILLIRDLGSDEWETREQATQQLLAMGPLAADRLRQTLDQTRDPEVRRRAQAILAEIN